MLNGSYYCEGNWTLWCYYLNCCGPPTIWHQNVFVSQSNFLLKINIGLLKVRALIRKLLYLDLNGCRQNQEPSIFFNSKITVAKRYVFTTLYYRYAVNYVPLSQEKPEWLYEDTNLKNPKFLTRIWTPHTINALIFENCSKTTTLVCFILFYKCEVAPLHRQITRNWRKYQKIKENCLKCMKMH